MRFTLGTTGLFKKLIDFQIYARSGSKLLENITGNDSRLLLSFSAVTYVTFTENLRLHFLILF